MNFLYKFFPYFFLKPWESWGDEYVQVFRDLPLDSSYYTLLVRSLLDEIKRRTPKKGKILEVGCGEGHLSRKLYDLGFSITACDLSSKLIQHVNQTLSNERLRYFICDVNKEKTVPQVRADMIVLNMVIMYLETIETVSLTLFKRLKPEGFLVLSLPHPCFFLKESHTWFQNMQRGLVVHDYFHENSFPITLGKRIMVSHYHKTLSRYINCFTRTGYSLVSMREVQGKVGKPSWIPYYLILTFQRSKMPATIGL